MPVFSKSLGSLNPNDPNAIKILANHIRIMQEELEYRLNNLDSGNINEINLDETEMFSIKADKKIVFDAGHVLTIDSDGATIVDGDGNAVKISHGNLELTGAITFTDLDKATQNAINAGITETEAKSIASTVITKELVAAPTIKGAKIYGGTYYDSDGNVSMTLDAAGGGFADFDIRSSSGSAFAIRDGGDTVDISGKGITFLMVSSSADKVYAYGSWDFSNATVTGL